MPNTIRTMPAARPAHSRILLAVITPPPVDCSMTAASRRPVPPPSGRDRRSTARKPSFPVWGTTDSPGLARHLVGPTHADARIEHDTAVAARTGLRSRLGDRRELLTEPAQPVNEVDERRDVRRGRPTETGHEPSRAPARHQLTRVDVGRGDPEDGIADELCQHAARAERDERPEHGVWTTPASSSAPPATMGWTMTGGPIRAAASATACSSASPSATPPVSVLCPRRRRLDDRGGPSSRAASTASSTPAATRSGTSGSPYATRSPGSPPGRARRRPNGRGRGRRSRSRGDGRSRRGAGQRRGRRSQDARSATRPSARAADSG